MFTSEDQQLSATTVARGLARLIADNRKRTKLYLMDARSYIELTALIVK